MKSQEKTKHKIPNNKAKLPNALHLLKNAFSKYKIYSKEDEYEAFSFY